MILKVQPAQFLKGKTILPGSKSYSIRAFMVALCGGQSTIINPSDCDDAIVAKNVAKAFGARITRIGVNHWKITAKKLSKKIHQINVRESGTVLRIVLPLICLYGRECIVKGERTLVGRPNHFLLDTLRRMGMDIRGAGEKESVPIYVNGGQLHGGKITIDGSLSSQFISALLIVCPQLNEDTHLTLTGEKLVSSDYIAMTLQVLKESGIKVQQKGARHFIIKGGQKFKGLKHFAVPADYGLAAFLMAAAALVSSNVTFQGYFDDRFIQADGQILIFFKKMGVKFHQSARAIKMKGPFLLKGGNFSLKACPDLVPIMAVLALFAKGKTRLCDISHARAKESDRISDLRKELLKVGARVEETYDTLTIIPQANYNKNCLLDPHHDHRLAMAFAVLGVKLGVIVKDIECTSKSYPQFVRDFQALGIKAP